MLVLCLVVCFVPLSSTIHLLLDIIISPDYWSYGAFHVYLCKVSQAAITCCVKLVNSNKPLGMLGAID